MTNLLVVLIGLASLGFSALIAAAAFTYIRRTWQLIRGEEDSPTQERILDGIDQVQIQLSALSSRLERLERTLEDPDGQAALPRTGGDERQAAEDRHP